MKQCTCGGREIYIKLVATYQQFYDYSGQATGATDPNIIRGGTMAYCADCDRRLGSPAILRYSEAEFMRAAGAISLFEEQR